MMRSVYLKTLYDKRWFIFGWTLGFIALAALMASFFPAMRQEDSFEALIDNMPSAFQGLVGDLSLLNQFDTYLAAQLFDIRLPILAGIMAIILGLGLSVGEEERGELRTTLALPVSRAKVFMQNWLAMVTIMALATLGLVAGIYAVLPFLEDAVVAGETMLELALMTWLMMVALGTLPFALGYGTGKRAIASFVSILAIIGSFLLSTFGQAVEWLQPYEKFSLFYYFPSIDIVKGSLDIWNVLFYILFALVLFVGAFVLFRRRDIG